MFSSLKTFHNLSHIPCFTKFHKICNIDRPTLINSCFSSRAGPWCPQDSAVGITTLWQWKKETVTRFIRELTKKQNRLCSITKCLKMIHNPSIIALWRLIISLKFWSKNLKNAPSGPDNKLRIWRRCLGLKKFKSTSGTGTEVNKALNSYSKKCKAMRFLPYYSRWINWPQRRKLQPFPLLVN